MAPTESALEIETPLAEAELDAAAALVREAGWNQIAADWRIFLDLGTVYVVRNEARRVIATAATLAYGGAFAWISMVLVAGDHRRRGLATRLLDRCVEDVTARGQVAILDATPAGRAVYLQLGFEDAWSYRRLERRGQGSTPAEDAPPGVAIRPIADADWPELCAFDAAAFGADRSAVLSRLRGRLPVAEFVARRAGRVAGFLLGRDGRTASQLGPLVAEDDAVATALLARGLAGVAGPLYVDLADAWTGVADWLHRQGFAVQRPFTRMLYRRQASFDDPARTFAVAGPELG
jgi:GNAT superfamily N-acetyltransferase